MKDGGKEKPNWPDWRALVPKEQLMEIDRKLGQTQKELERLFVKWEPKQIVGKTQEELESIFAKWNPEQAVEMRFKVLRYNQVSVLIKILFVNREFLNGVIDHYDSGEPVILATLARCTFELFLATRDAFSSPERFREFVGRTVASVIRFNERVLDEAIILGMHEMEQSLHWELVRLEQRKKLYSELMGPIPSTARPDLNFKDLANRFGLGENYDFDYGILSLFVHPSLFYVAIAPKMVNLLSEEEKSSKWQSDVVKAWSLDIAVDCSRMMLTFAESFRDILDKSFRKTN